VLVVRGSPIHYLLIRANRYSGRVALVDNVDDAVRQLLQSAASGHHADDEDDDDDDVVLLTDAVIADHISRHVRSIASYASAGIATAEMSVCLSHSGIVVSKRTKLCVMIYSPTKSLEHFSFCRYHVFTFIPKFERDNPDQGR